MWPFPDYTVTIRTHLTRQQVIARLEEMVEPSRFRWWFGFFSPPDSAPYEGTVGLDVFEITRVDYYHRLYTPIIHGEIRHAGRETLIRLTLSPSPIMYFVLAPIMMFFVAIVLIAAANENNFIPIVMFAIFSIFAYASIAVSARWGGNFDIALLRGLFNDLDRTWGKAEWHAISSSVAKGSPLSGPHYDRDQLTRRGEKPKRRNWWRG